MRKKVLVALLIASSFVGQISAKTGGATTVLQNSSYSPDDDYGNGRGYTREVDDSKYVVPQRSNIAMTAMLREANSALLELKHAEREHKKELDMAQRAYLDVRSARRRQETYIKALRASYKTQYKAERSSQTFHTYDSEAYSQRTVMPTGGITYYGASK